MTWVMKKFVISSPKDSQQGFTLIEMLVALAVMAFGLLGFLFLQGRAAQGRVAGREMGRAVIVAQSFSETLRALNYNDSLLDTGSHPTASEDTTDGNADNQISTKYGNFIYNTTWTVSNDASRMKTIIITTSWRLKDNQKGMQTKRITLTLLKSR
jgi:type IV pilus assembly protein PilV